MKTEINKELWKIRFLSTILKTVDTFVTFTQTSTSVTSSVTGFGLNAIPASAANARGLTLFIEFLFEIFKNKIIEKKCYERAQQTLKNFDKPCKKSLHVNVIVKNEYESSFIVSKENISESGGFAVRFWYGNETFSFLELKVETKFEKFKTKIKLYPKLN